MTYLLAISLCLTVPLIVGYFNGYKDTNPDTPEGKLYYSKENTK